MPPKKRQKQTSKKAAKGNMIRGSGSQSRIALDFEKLREAGWTIRQEERQSFSGVKILFCYTNPGGKTLKSAKDVERQLRDEGVLQTFQTTQADVNFEQEQKSETDDSDYEPPRKQLWEESDVECISIPEGLFVAMTSSLQSFVQEFNAYFKCPSKEGRCKGKLVLAASEKKGLGGSMKFLFRCNGYWIEEISYVSSQLASESRRHLVASYLSCCKGNEKVDPSPEHAFIECAKCIFKQKQTASKAYQCDRYIKHIEALVSQVLFQDTNDDRRDLTLFEDIIHQTAKLTSDTDEVKVLLKQT